MAPSKSLITFVLLASLFGVHIAHAQPGVRSTSVRYGDLDLRRPEAQRSLSDRVEAAARQVCESGSARSLLERRLATLCVKDARSRAAAVLFERGVNLGSHPADRARG